MDVGVVVVALTRERQPFALAAVLIKDHKIVALADRREVAVDHAGVHQGTKGVVRVIPSGRDTTHRRRISPATTAAETIVQLADINQQTHALLGLLMGRRKAA